MNQKKISIVSMLLVLMGLAAPTHAMRRMAYSTAYLREVYNQNDSPVYLHYTSPEGRRMAHVISSGETWEGFAPIPSDELSMALIEPRSGNTRHITQTEPIMRPLIMPRGLRHAVSEPDLLSRSTGIKIVENYVINYATRTIESPEGIRLIVSPLAFSPIRSADQSGIVVDRFTPHSPT